MTKCPAYRGVRLIEVSRLSEVFKKFLQLPGSKVTFTIQGRRVNRGAGYGLEIPVRASLSGHAKAVAWAKQKITSIFQEHDARVQRCNKNI